MRSDRQLLVIAHLSQLSMLFTAIGGWVIPLILWLTQKEKVYAMDAQGRAILNFQISTFLLSLICIPLILLFGLGLLGIFVIGIVLVIYPIINAVRVSRNEEPRYPLTFNFL